MAIVDDIRITRLTDRTTLGRLLKESATKLTHLTMAVEDLGQNHTIYRVGYMHLAMGGASQAFDAFLADTTFQHLQYLHLAGWVYTVNTIKAFLLKHKSTLRQVRLVYNMMLDGCSSDLAQWAGKVLPELEGVEIYNSTESRAPFATVTLQTIDLIEHEEMWVNGRSNCLDKLRLVPIAKRTWRDSEQDDDEIDGENAHRDADELWWSRELPWHGSFWE